MESSDGREKNSEPALVVKERHQKRGREGRERRHPESSSQTLLKGPFVLETILDHTILCSVRIVCRFVRRKQ